MGRARGIDILRLRVTMASLLFADDLAILVTTVNNLRVLLEHVVLMCTAANSPNPCLAFL